MSDSEHSTVTYTSVSEDDSDIGSPGVDGPPIMPEDPYAYIMAAYEVPPSPDYIPGPEVPPSPDYIPGPEGPPSPDYVPGPEEPEQAPPSPVYLPYVPEPVYPEYIPPEDDVFLAEEQPLHAATSPTAESPGYIPEEEDNEDPEEDPADYPADRDDDNDEDEDEEEEHPALADSVPPVYRMTARISIRDEPSISLPPREEVERLLALTTPPPSLLTPLSSPLPHIPSPPLPIPSPPPNSPTHIEIPESCLPLQKRVRFASPTPSHEVEESSAAGTARQDRPAILDYDITDTWDDLVGTIDEIAPTTLEGVNLRVTDLATIVKEETTSMDRLVHHRLAVMIEREAKMAHEAWGLSMDASDYTRSNVMLLRTTVVVQSALISELQSADHRRQRVISELLASDHKRQKMAPKRKTTRLNPDATPTPVTDTHTTTSVTNSQILAMINKGVTAALAAHDATRNGDDGHTSGTGARRPVQVARECTYLDFLKCQPLNFKGTGGVVGLTQWFEKMESVYSISNCIVACQVKFAICTLQGNALTWWNSHVKTTTLEASHAMP
ncbi:hypothetical protein Tco_1262054 [Tanacetum coccineum]